MADSLHEAASSLQPPAMQPSSLTAGDDVLDGSRRSSASRDRPSQGSSTAAGSFLTLSPSASSSREAPPESTLASISTTTHLQPNARASSDGISPPRLPQRHGQSPDTSYLSNASSSSSRQNYELSPSPSNSNSISPPNPIANTNTNTSNARASRTASHRNSHRHNRSSGAFLLSDSLGSGGHSANSHGKSTHTRSSQRESTTGSHKNRSSVGRVAGSRLSIAPETPEKRAALSSPADNNTPESTHSPHSTHSAHSSGSSKRSHGSSTNGTARAQTPEDAAPASSSSPAVPAAPALPTGQPLDLDSAQIVNMALNLSESRRLAARRNVSVSQQLPPRLAPLPDSAVGGSLLRQLQQQRRISRTMSPKPDRGGAGGRVSSSGQFPPGMSPRMSTSSALQPPFELLPDGSTAGSPSQYRYHFSQSTLARAQKAKDYLELLAQHRRLLELIPPLTPAAAARSRATSIGSPPTTSNNAGQPQSLFLTGTNSNGDLVLGSTRLGRPYNPLQYIRNRKVRVRERRAIDGQAQGFGDVARATDWVDEVAKWTATGQGRMLGGYTLPAFATADADAALQSSPPPASRAAGQSVLAKPKRPRIDWVIDPADMIADVYWLEQGDNKKLVEDHHWRRVFPQDSSLYQPVFQRADDSMAGIKAGDQADIVGNIPTLTADGDISTANSKPLYAMPVGAHLKPVENSPEPDHGSARKRAHQKLSELRSFHHRHNSSVHSQDVQRLRRGSLSDTSDSDNDRRWFSRARADSGTANSAEVLNKNMMGKIARENRERDETAAASAAAAASSSATGAASAAAAAASSIEKKRTTAQQPASANVTPSNGKQTARPESTKAAAKAPATAAPIDSPSKPGRASLEIPTVGRRLSLEYDSSRPTSPELRPFSKDGLGFVPPLGGDLSPPPSRAHSPPRHRFGKVKSIFRDLSRERDHRDRDRDRDRDRANKIILDRGEDYMEPGARPGTTSQQHQQQNQDYVESTSAPLTTVSTVADDLRFASSNEAKGPHSPIRKIGTRPSPGTFDTHRSHSSISSITGHLHSTNTNHNSHHQKHNHNRSEEGGSSGGGTLRGFFRGGPRIDTMLRSGVSKVSDILWRREGSEPPFGDASAASAAGAHMSQQSSSDDDSESEAAPRGRFRISTLPSRTPSVNSGPLAADKLLYSTLKPSEKHYLDVMPTFGRAGGEDPITRPPSRQSARFERLKPPRIDVSDASPSADDAANNLKQLGEASSSTANRRNSSLQPLGRQPHRGSQDSDYSESDTRSRRSSRVSGAASSVSGSLAGGAGALQPLPRKFGSTSATSGIKGDRPRWSLSQPAYNHHHGSLSRRELARLRASMYSSAVLAKELSRRANEPKVLVRSWDSANGNGMAKANTNAITNGNGNGSARRRSSTALDAAVVDTAADADDEADQPKQKQNDDDAEATVPNATDSGPIVVRGSNGEQSLTWADIAAYGPDPAELARRPVKQVELYPLAAQVLGSAIQRSGHSWQISAETFANTTVPQLRQRIEGVRTRVSVELSGLARQAADEADEVTRDLMAVQRLQVKRVEDSIEKMLRRRRRRFRWVRRAGWLTVEWLLVGFMWYVWFVVMLARIILGFGRGLYSGVRWLLWL